MMVVLLALGGLVSASVGSAAAGPRGPSALGGTPIEQINLVSPTGQASTAGVAEVLRKGHSYRLAIVAQGVQPVGADKAYEVWLWRSRKSAKLLGLVNPGPDIKERLQTQGSLPGHPARYRKLLITLESRSHPGQLGKIVLQGKWPYRIFKLTARRPRVYLKP